MTGWIRSLLLRRRHDAVPMPALSERGLVRLAVAVALLDDGEEPAGV